MPDSVASEPAAEESLQTACGGGSCVEHHGYQHAQANRLQQLLRTAALAMFEELRSIMRALPIHPATPKALGAQAGGCGYGHHLPSSALTNCRPCHSERPRGSGNGCGFDHRLPSLVRAKRHSCHSERPAGSNGRLRCRPSSVLLCAHEMPLPLRTPCRPRLAVVASATACPPLCLRSAAPATPNALQAQAGG